MFDQPNGGQWPQPLRWVKYLTCGARPVVTRIVWFRSAAGGLGHSTQGFIHSHVVRVSGMSCESGIGLQFIMTFAPHSYVDFVLNTIEKIREIKTL